MDGFDAEQLIADMASAPTAVARFAALVAGVRPLGIETVNYGFFDSEAAIQAGAEVSFLTTMSDDWMAYYYDYKLERRDMHVDRLRSGKIAPYVWSAGMLAGMPEDQKRTALEGAEAGLVSGMCVPLGSRLNPARPVAAINFGAALDGRDFGEVARVHGLELASIAHILHNASIPQIRYADDTRRTLSSRERDCLQLVADGRRHEAIAHRLGLARITVDMHLRSARTKLEARTLSQAVAKGLLLGEITHG